LDAAAIRKMEGILEHQTAGGEIAGGEDVWVEEVAGCGAGRRHPGILRP